MQLGKANYGTTKKRFKIEDGDNVYRILPPMGELAEKGIWAKYYSVVWGYKNSAGKAKPFVDPSERNRSNGMMEKVSAALARRQKLESQKEQMKKAGATPEQLKQTNEILMNFNIESKYYVNAVNLKGEIGLLKIGSKAYRALVGDKKKNEKGLIDRLLDRNIDPISSLDNGRYFNFFRQGTGLNTTYTVTVYQENVVINGQEYQQDKVHVIDDALIRRLEKEAYNLGKLFPTPSLEEVERIVKEGPTAVDAILGGTTVEEVVAEDSEEMAVEETVSAAPAPQQAPVAATVVSTPVPTPEVTPAPVIVASASAQASSAPAVPAFDPDEFLRSMGAKVD
jgi:hypothetical protein